MLRLVFIIFRKKGDFTSSIFLLKLCEATRCLYPQHSPHPHPHPHPRDQKAHTVFYLLWYCLPNVVPSTHYCAWPMRFGSRGPSLGYVTENALTMKASEDTVQGHGLGLYAPQLRGLCHFHRQTLRERRRMGLGNDYATFPCARSYLPSKQGLK